MLNQHRDTLASHIAHPASLSYIAVVENETLARKKYDLVSKMVQPCGKPPKPKIPE